MKSVGEKSNTIIQDDDNDDDDLGSRETLDPAGKKVNSPSFLLPSIFIKH